MEQLKNKFKREKREKGKKRRVNGPDSSIDTDYNHATV